MQHNKKLDEIEKYARLMNIPVIEKESSLILVDLVKEIKPKNILEIGTAIGYSASLMLLNSSANLITIEKLQDAISVAKENFKALNLCDRVQIIYGDANEEIKALCLQKKMYDFIFLDGPKSKYLQELPYLLRMLEVGGVIVADDVLFKGMVLSGEYPKHTHRTIVMNLRKFIRTVQENPDLDSKLIEIEDGLLIIKKLR